MSNAGQSCISAKRFIVHQKISKNFISLFHERIARLTSGDPLDEGTEIGPLANIAQAELVEKQVNKSIGMGARLLTGGIRSSAFYSPVLMVDVHPGMPVFDEEVFGPVAPVIIASDTNEAIELAGRTRFGLGVTLFTGNPDKAVEMVNDFKDGAVFINDLVKSDPRLPFGGTGRSGFGRELALHGIREFVNVKTVYVREL
jgi:succinate-semialdehyde dehydrogenase/glutarate-semialdehyde dehydrogenase